MKLKQTLLIAALFASSAALAQEADDIAARMQEVEARLLAQEAEREARAAERQATLERREAERQAMEEARAQELARVENVRQTVEVEIEAEQRMREAERRLAEAAQQVAELSMAQLPRVEQLEQLIRTSRGPVLGVTIGESSERGPVAGVELLAVSPGGAAAESGLRAGDVITAINGEAFTADSSDEANAMLLDFMEGVELGDTLDIEYLRNGQSRTAELSPRPIEESVFAFDFNGRNFTVPGAPVAPLPPSARAFVWRSGGHGFGDMELVKLTERLGSYFDADEGLLVVRAPDNEELQLEDGDVILSIDGRVPTSVAHAIRILASYEGGEELKMEIMRDKRKRTIELQIPENLQGSRWAAPVFPSAVTPPDENIVVIQPDKI